MMNNFTLDLANEAATLAFGVALAKVMHPNLTLYLHGDLGAGKTTLVRGLMHGMGFAGKVKSPTYTLVEPYEVRDARGLPFTLYHFDLYRFNDDEEWESAGFRDYFNANSVCLIEWPEKAQNVLPQPDVEVRFVIKSSGRTIHLLAHSKNGLQLIEQLNIRNILTNDD